MYNLSYKIVPPTLVSFSQLSSQTLVMFSDQSDDGSSMVLIWFDMIMSLMTVAEDADWAFCRHEIVNFKMI